MNEFMKQAHAFNRFQNTLSDDLDYLRERKEVITKSLCDLDLNGSLSAEQTRDLISFGINLPDFSQNQFAKLRDELSILLYQEQLLEAEIKRFQMLFTPFFGVEK